MLCKNQVLRFSKWQFMFRFCPRLGYLVLRFPRVPFVGTYLLTKNQINSIYMLCKNQVLRFPKWQFVFRFCPRLSYFGTQIPKSPFRWYSFIDEEPNKQYLHAVQEPGTHLLSKLQLCLCLDFVQDSVTLVLRFPSVPLHWYLPVVQEHFAFICGSCPRASCAGSYQSFPYQIKGSAVNFTSSEMLTSIFFNKSHMIFRTHLQHNLKSTSRSLI